MNSQPLTILLIEDNLADVNLIEELLAEGNTSNFKLKNVRRLETALESLSWTNFDIVLLDLSLPDSQGIESIAQIKEKAPHIPVVVLTALNDRNVAISSVRKGAQDYLVKGKFEGELLVRSIRYAIERQRTEDTLRQQAERERLMKKMLEHIRQSLDLKEILKTTVAEVRQFLKTDRVLIYRCGSNQPGEIIAESVDLANEITNQEMAAKLNFSELLPESQETVAIADTGRANIEKDNIYLLAEHKIKAILTLPIWKSQQINESSGYFYCPITDNAKEKYLINQLWGMLVAHNYSTSRQWQQWEINFLEQLATQVAIAIQQSELYAQLRLANQKLQQLATQDGLTEVANRRQFDQVLNSEWQRLARQKKPLSLILCDIDFFKAYNDNYGHPAGDSCLKKVAAVLRKAIKRSTDLVARYGGEEFAVILPDTDPNGASFIANSIRRQLEVVKLPHYKSTVSKYVTLSMGVTTAIPNPNGSASTLVETADRALYQAKARGRNQIFSSII